MDKLKPNSIVAQIKYESGVLQRLLDAAAQDIITLRQALADLAEEFQGLIDGAPESEGRDQWLSGQIRTIEYILQETK
jgi:hypothetical protein